MLYRLAANFEPADNTSLPRNGLYDAYDDHCGRTASSPVNVASFGKIIRAVFPGIQTRRLGVRGMSRYYYHGIRVRHQSPLADNAILQTNRSDDTYRYRGAVHTPDRSIVRSYGTDVPIISNCFFFEPCTCGVAKGTAPAERA